VKHSNKVALAVLTAALYGAGAAVASADPATGDQVSVTGSVVHEYAGQLVLQSGQTIYLNDGTVIKPSDASQLEGARITVVGEQNSQDGSINADEIDVAGPAR
jgi:hypothetical protein